MILSWTTSALVVSRVMRNIKGVEAEFVDDIPEWIAEGVAKLKTRYGLAIDSFEIPIHFHVGRVITSGVAPIGVEHYGHMLQYKPSVGNPNRGDWAYHKSFIENLFISDIPIYTTTGDPLTKLDDYTGGNPFPRDIIQRLIKCPEDPNDWFTLEGQTIRTSLKDTCVRLWAWVFPKDENGFPLIPDVEEYQEALYWYVRMKLVEAGFEDKVFNHSMLETKWNHYAGQAIGQITYPTPEQGEEMIHRHLNYFPHLYNWGATINGWEIV